MFIVRLASGAVLVLIAFFCVFFGGYLLWALTFLLSLLGMYELFSAFSLQKSLPSVFSYLAACAYYITFLMPSAPDALLIPTALLLLLLSAMVFSYPKMEPKAAAVAFFGFFYVAVLLSFVYRMRLLDGGMYLTFLIFICCFGCDTFAYCTGMLFGRHKMTPNLSPKKSVEGAVGGVVCVAVLATVYGILFLEQMSLTSAGVAVLAAFSALCALVDMVGDLAASAIKRFCGIKDFGKLIPGHGGVLDRFDSMILVAPFLYYLADFLLPLVQKS